MALCTNSKVSCLYNILIIYIDKYRHTLLLACVPQIDTMHPLSVEGSNLTITHWHPCCSDIAVLLLRVAFYRR